MFIPKGLVFIRSLPQVLMLGYYIFPFISKLDFHTKPIVMELCSRIVLLVIPFYNYALSKKVDQPKEVPPCRDYPGDVKFVYETTLDEQFYNIKYGGPVVYKYRRTITRRRSYSPIVQQVQQQQVYGKMNLNNMLKNNVQVEIPATNESEPQPLPIWKIQLPQNAMHVWINKAQDGKLLEPFELGKDEFGNSTMTTHNSAYQKVIDITDKGITPEEWYLICMDLSVSYSKATNPVCQHCTLLRAATDDGRQVGVSASLAPLYTTANSVRIKYQVDDIPFNMAMIVSQAYPTLESASERCTMLNKTATLVQSTDLAPPNTVVFVDLDGLSDMYAYRVITGLVIGLEKNQKVAVNFYLSGDTGLQISKCSRFR